MYCAPSNRPESTIDWNDPILTESAKNDNNEPEMPQKQVDINMDVSTVAKNATLDSCATCACSYPLVKWDYSRVQEKDWKEPQDGYVCTLFTDPTLTGGRVKVIWMVGCDPTKDKCEMWRERA